MDVEVADFNNDGRPDIAGASWGLGGGIRVWLGDGTGSWSAVPPLAYGNFYGLCACDINNDGNVDLVAGSYRDGVHIFLGDGKGSFEAAPGPVDSGSYWRAICHDINGDGKMDIIAGSVDGKGVRGWINRDGKRWAEVEDIFPTLGNYYDFKSADLNNDGNKELILASFGEGIKIIPGEVWPYSRSLRSFSGILDEGDPDERQEVFENSVFTMKNGYEEYKVGPGDALEITLWEPDKVTKEEVEVMPDGTLTFSFVKDLAVNGMTVKEIDNVLTAHLDTYIRNPRISLRINFYHSKWASIMGPGRGYHTGGGGGWSGERGRRGGRFYLDGRVTLIELLSGAGIARDANLREILVTRSDGRTLKLNIYKAMTLGDKTQDIIIDHGDSVYISIISQEGNRIFVFGEVRQPGAYSFTGTTMPTLDLIAAAGGPTVFALLDQARIIRGDITKPEVISVDLKQLVETGDQSQNIPLMDGDIVYVSRTAIGDVDLFVQRMRPFLTLITSPLRTYDYFDDLND
jgi:polysaccharide export outer membrane protein